MSETNDKEVTVNIGSENALQMIDIIAEKEFTANGKKYFLEPQVSVERFRKMSEFEIELSYSTTFKRMYAGLNELREILNQAKFVDAAVKLRDIQEGMQRVTDTSNHHPIMKYCALIINSHEEDRRAYDEKIMEEKIKDWEEEGIPIASFFAVVLHTVDGLPGSLRDVILSTSDKSQNKS